MTDWHSAPQGWKSLMPSDPAVRPDVIELFRSNRSLAILFSLYYDKHRTVETCLCHFLFSYVLDFSSKYVVNVAISDRVISQIIARGGDLDHSGMHVIAEMSDMSAKGSDLISWFYAEAVPRLPLAPFLTSSELTWLGAFLADRDAPGRSSQKAGLNGIEDALGMVAQCARSRYLRPWTRLAPRVAIIGYHGSILGLGEDARSLCRCLCEIGIAPELIDVSPPELERDDQLERYRSLKAARPTGQIVIFCMPAFEMMRTIVKLGLARPPEPHFWVGYWPWETTAMSTVWNGAFDEIDEIWASSTFLEKTYSASTTKPVILMPLHIEVAPPQLTAELGELLEHKFTFLSIFDFNSHLTRKNPAAAIKAFRMAFPEPWSNAQLILKTLHADAHPSDLDKLRRDVAGDERILIVDGALSRPEVSGLIAASQAYVSLHRAEGFGRPIAEAMMLGTPVVATQWSGPADFLTEETGFPVWSSLRPVRPEEYPFAAGSWAEPDVAQAAAQMRLLRNRPALARHRAETAQVLANAKFGLDAVSQQLRSRLEIIAERLHRPHESA